MALAIKGQLSRCLRRNGLAQIGAGLLFEPGVLARARKRRRPMPLMVANHTMRRVWALVGSAPVATLR